MLSVHVLCDICNWVTECNMVVWCRASRTYGQVVSHKVLHLILLGHLVVGVNVYLWVWSWLHESKCVEVNK